MNVRSTDTVVFAGLKEEGKSYLAARLFSMANYGVVWDDNHEHSSLGLVVHEVSQITRESILQHRKIVFQPYNQTVELFELVAQRILEIGNLMFMAEEANLYLGNGDLPPHTKRLVNSGRHVGVGLMAITRRPADLNKTIYTLRAYLFIFRLNPGVDQRYMAREVGEEWADRICGNEEKGVPALARYHFIVWSNSGISEHAPV